MLLLTQMCLGYSQNVELNFQKYLNYRERLFRYYIATSPNDEKGTNIPGMRIKDGVLNFGDGNGGLPYYIGWLATEYRLLQLYDQDISETRNLLLWALKAVERLDRTAEMYFRGNNIPLTGS